MRSLIDPILYSISGFPVNLHFPILRTLWTAVMWIKHGNSECVFFPHRYNLWLKIGKVYTNVGNPTTQISRWEKPDLILYIPVVYVIYQLHHVASELQMTTIQVLSPAWGNKRWRRVVDHKHHTDCQTILSQGLPVSSPNIYPNSLDYRVRHKPQSPSSFSWIDDNTMDNRYKLRSRSKILKL